MSIPHCILIFHFRMPIHECKSHASVCTSIVYNKIKLNKHSLFRISTNHKGRELSFIIIPVKHTQYMLLKAEILRRRRLFEIGISFAIKKNLLLLEPLLSNPCISIMFNWYQTKSPLCVIY